MHPSGGLWKKAEVKTSSYSALNSLKYALRKYTLLTRDMHPFFFRKDFLLQATLILIMLQLFLFFIVRTCYKVVYGLKFRVASKLSF